MPELKIDKELQHKINYGHVSLIELLKDNGFILTNSIKQTINADGTYELSQ